MLNQQQQITSITWQKIFTDVVGSTPTNTIEIIVQNILFHYHEKSQSMLSAHGILNCYCSSQLTVDQLNYRFLRFLFADFYFVFSSVPIWINNIDKKTSCSIQIAIKIVSFINNKNSEMKTSQQLYTSTVIPVLFELQNAKFKQISNGKQQIHPLVTYLMCT